MENNMLHIYVYDIEFKEVLQYSHSLNLPLNEVKKGMSKPIFYTENIKSEKPQHKRCWLISPTLLNYGGYDDMITEKLNYTIY